MVSWKSCTLTGCWYSNKSWNIKSKYTPRFSGCSWHTIVILLLNRQRLNSRNHCQAASIIIEELNLQKKFHIVKKSSGLTVLVFFYQGITAPFTYILPFINLTPPRNPLISCVSAANCYFLGVVRVTKVYIELHASMHRWYLLTL